MEAGVLPWLDEARQHTPTSINLNVFILNKILAYDRRNKRKI
jgi:hypothetical protein